MSTWLTKKEKRTPFVVFEANRLYWNSERGPRLGKVVFRNDLSPQKALDLCINTEGQVDLVTNVSSSDAPKVTNSAFAKLVVTKGNSIVIGQFNRFQRDINFDNISLRLAINFAVKREDIINQVYHGYADLIPALTPPYALDFPEGLCPRTYDPNLARQLLKEANWPKGRILRIAATSEYEKLARVVAWQVQQTLQIGTEVMLISAAERIKWLTVVAEKKLIPTWDILITDAVAFFFEATPAFLHREFFGADGALRTGPKLPEFDSLFQRMAVQTNEKLRNQAAKEIDRYVYEEALGLFLFAPQKLYAVNKHVNFVPYRTTFELAETYVGSKHWSLSNI